MGSKSDWPVMQAATATLESLGIRFEARVLSAHRTPEEAAGFVRDAVERGCGAFICAAGMAAHLAGAVAAQTVRPVIGVPIDAGSLGGIDALLSTVQMPGGIPVATVAIGKAGAKNAAFLAAQIFAVQDPALAEALLAERAANRANIAGQDSELQQELQ
jgi:phosphoribosylaminoimidazole carboxylase PurE protein